MMTAHEFLVLTSSDTIHADLLSDLLESKTDLAFLLSALPVGSEDGTACRR